MPKIIQDLSRFDLSECTFDSDNDEDFGLWINAVNKNGGVIDSIYWDKNIFRIMGRDETDFKDYEPQIETLNILFKYHFDVFGLIDAGLAIDINTLDNEHRP